MTGTTGGHHRAIREFEKAEEIFALTEDVDRWAKVRNGITVSEWQAYLVDGNPERLRRGVNLQETTIAEAKERLSKYRLWQTDQEKLNAAVLLAKYEEREHDVKTYIKEMVNNREQWIEWVKEEGQTHNPWALALIMCDAARFLYEKPPWFQTAKEISGKK